MTRTLTILAAVAALAVTAAPIASAHREPDEAGNMEFNAKTPTPRGTAGYTHMEQIEWLTAPQEKGATNLRTVAVDRPPVAFVFDLSLVGDFTKAIIGVRLAAIPGAPAAMWRPWLSTGAPG